VYQHTRTRTDAVVLVYYNALARGIEVSESHSAIAELQASNSSVEKEAFVYLVNTPDQALRTASPGPEGTIPYDSHLTRIYRYPQADACIIA